ncbi:hypothetical protein ZWY2020_029504 [Hordeum vulgare]|nr:hypothetical protein ZWY2020_029504 [Hordeum vulgare]
MDLLKFLMTPLLLSLLTHQTYVGAASDDEGFSKQCSPHRCSKHGPEIRFPFGLSSCGAPGMQLSCSGDDIILDHPVLGSCKVTEIYYRHRVINVARLWNSCSAQFRGSSQQI